MDPIPAARPRVPVVIAARNERVRTALWTLLASEEGIEPVGATGDLAELIRLLGRVGAAVAVIDESVFGAAGLRWLPTVAQAAPGAGLVVVGMHDHPAFVGRARDAGAADYVRLDDADRLASAVVAASEPSAPPAARRRRAGARRPAPTRRRPPGTATGVGSRAGRG